MKYKKILTLASVAIISSSTFAGLPTIVHGAGENSDETTEQNVDLVSDRQQYINDFYAGEIDARAISFSNQELFDELEANGIDIYDIFTQEEIDQAIAEDTSPLRAAGKTQAVSTGDYTWTLYLSSTYTKVLKYGGQASGIILGLLGFGKTGAVLELAGIPLSELDSSRGIYLNLKNVNIQGAQPSITVTGWGYQ